MYFKLLLRLGYRMGCHLRDFLIQHFPISLHSSSGIYIRVRDRSQMRLYEQIFVEDVFGVSKMRNIFNNKPHPTIFDIGANCGFFTVRALDCWPSANIYAFEPNTQLITDIDIMLEMNNLRDRVTYIKSAVGRENGKTIFYQNRSPISSSLIRDKVSKRRIIKQTCVPMVSLNQYIIDNSITNIDLLKIDVEGAEYDVLEGATNILSAVSLLFIEVHPPYSQLDRVESILGKYSLTRAPSLERSDEGIDLVFINKRIIPKETWGQVFNLDNS